jgi:molybdate transport system permease protein
MSRRVRAEHGALAITGGLLVLFLAAPLFALIATSTLSGIEAGLANPHALPALRLSLQTTLTSLAVVVVLGTPLAWTLARSQSRWARALETVVQLPIVVPPSVAGVAMLLAFGRRGLFTQLLFPEGFSLPFTTAAVVVAEVFVSAPFFVEAAASAFRRIDADLVVVARTFGASPLRVFGRIALPLAAPGVIAGAALSWARSLGEFGATLMFAGNLQGRTQTLPLAIYTALEVDLRAARALSVVLVIVAFALLMFVRGVLRRWLERGEGAT